MILLILLLLQYSLYLNAIVLKKYVIKLLALVLLYLVPYLTDKILKKYVIKLIPKNLLG